MADIFQRFVQKPSKGMYTIQNEEDHVSKTMKNFFFNNWYCQSQSQDLKPNTKRNFRQPAQPKRDSAFEQKTRIVSSREISVRSQNIFCSYSQRGKQSRAQTDICGTYSTSIWKVSVFFSVRSHFIFRTVCTKIIKTIAHNPKRRRPRFQKIKSCFFLNIRYRKTSQTQDVKSQSAERSLRKLAQAKPNTAVEQKWVLNHEH